MGRKGRHPSETLTGHFVHTAQVLGFYSDGDGLFLRVDALGSQRCVLRKPSWDAACKDAA
jgi:hypothetical protein